MNTKTLFILVILISINASKGIGQTKLDTCEPLQVVCFESESVVHFHAIIH